MWQPGWVGSLGERGGMAESLCRSPETMTTLVTGYAPIQNKKFEKIIMGES